MSTLIWTVLTGEPWLVGSGFMCLVFRNPIQFVSISVVFCMFFSWLLWTWLSVPVQSNESIAWKDLLQRVLNVTACIVTGTQKFDHDLSHDKLHWLNVPGQMFFELAEFCNLVCTDLMNCGHKPKTGSISLTYFTAQTLPKWTWIVIFKSAELDSLWADC